jgi:hypothetical protein
MKVSPWLKDMKEQQAERAAIRKRISGLVEEEYRKRKQYQSLVGTELNYQIIQDFINATAQGVEVVISFPGGQTMKMTRTIPADALARMKQWGELF